MSDYTNGSMERLRQLLGSKLADKLIEDCKKASAEYARLVSDVTVKAFNDRMSLTGDELAEPRFNLVREEAASLLKGCLGAFISCEVVALSCVLHSAQDVSMTSYVAHVVGHYEAEQKKRKIEKVVSIVEALSNNEPNEDDVHHAAKSHSSDN